MWRTPSFSKFSPELGTLQKVVVRTQNVTVTEQRIIDIDDSLGGYQWNNYPVTLHANCLFPLNIDLEPTIDIIENVVITGDNDDAENEYNGGPDEYSFVVQHHYTDATIESESTDILLSVIERSFWSPIDPNTIPIYVTEISRGNLSFTPLRVARFIRGEPQRNIETFSKIQSISGSITVEYHYHNYSDQSSSISNHAVGNSAMPDFTPRALTDLEFSKYELLLFVSPNSQDPQKTLIQKSQDLTIWKDLHLIEHTGIHMVRIFPEHTETGATFYRAFEYLEPTQRP